MAVFADRDLYVVCFDVGTGIVRAHVDPKQLGIDIRSVKQADGQPFGQRIFNAARPGTIATVDYLFPAPGGAVGGRQAILCHAGRQRRLPGGVLQIGPTQARIIFAAPMPQKSPQRR